jgi:hypothetical protein
MDICAEQAADTLRYAFRRALDYSSPIYLPTADVAPVPILSRLFKVTPSVLLERRDLRLVDFTDRRLEAEPCEGFHA